MVVRPGWPYGLPAPTLTRAAAGRSAARKGALVEKLEPWCPTLRTSIGRTSPRSRRRASTDAFASPVSRALNAPKVSRPTTDALLMSFSRSGPVASAGDGYQMARLV
jgi:hypothetical protein